MPTYVVNIIVQGEDKASGPLGKVHSALGGIGSIAGGVLAAGVLQNIASGIVNMGRSALESIAYFERLEFTLTGLAAREMLTSGGAATMAEALSASSEKGKELLGWVQNLAIKSPFSIRDVEAGLRMGMVYGFNIDQAKRLTQATLDMAAGSGMSGDAMTQVTFALGQMQAKGKLASEEVRQMANAGFPALDAIARSLGVTTAEAMEMISKGQISAAQGYEAIVGIMETDFGGAAERQTATWAGLMSTMGDLKELGLKELFSGIAEAMQPFVAGFATWLQGPGLIKLKEMGASIGGFVTQMIGLVTTFSDFDPIALADIFGEGDMGTAVEGFLQAIDRIVSVFRDSWPMVKGHLDGLVQWFQNMAAQAAPGILTNLTSLLDGIAAFWAANGPTVMQVVDFVVKIAGATGMGAVQLISGLAGAIGDLLAGNPQAALDTIKTTLLSFADTALGVVGQNWSSFVTTWTTNFDMAKTIFVEGGKRIVEGLKSGFSNAWTGLIALLKTKVSELITAVKKLLGIKSPSSVFEGIAENMMGGMTVGIQGSAGGPANAMRLATAGVAASGSHYDNRAVNIGQVNNYNREDDVVFARQARRWLGG